MKYQYDDIGNIRFRSDVGTYLYGQDGNGPHAVTKIIKGTGSSNVSEHIFNPYGDYIYDKNGHLIETNIDGDNIRKVDWSPFHKPTKMVDIVDGEIRTLRYTYGSDLQRITKSANFNSKSIRYYGGGSTERIIEDSKVFWKYYLPVGSATLELKVREIKQGSDFTYTQAEKQYLFQRPFGLN